MIKTPLRIWLGKKLVLDVGYMEVVVRERGQRIAVVRGSTAEFGWTVKLEQELRTLFVVLVKSLKYVGEQKAALAQILGCFCRCGVREETSPVWSTNWLKARGERFSPDCWADLTCLVATWCLVWDRGRVEGSPSLCWKRSSTLRFLNLTHQKLVASLWAFQICLVHEEQGSFTCCSDLFRTSPSWRPQRSCLNALGKRGMHH